MKNNKNEKFALITGASSGISKEICKILFDKGYNLLKLQETKMPF